MLPGSAKLVQVRRYAVFNGTKFHITTALTQLRQVRLRVALVRAFEVVGERDVTNLSFAMPFDNSFGNIVETLCTTRPGIVDAGYAGVIEEPQVYIANILNVDKVAQLLAVTVAIRPRKQARLAAIEYLVVEMESNARHCPFVLFARAVHIEVAKPDDLTIRLRCDTIRA